MRIDELKIGDILVRRSEPSKFMGTRWKVVQFKDDYVILQSLRNGTRNRTATVSNTSLLKRWEFEDDI